MEPQPAILEARGLVVDYPGVRALDTVDFDLRRGEIHAVMGENGAGKSTLINVLSGAVQPERGSIAIERTAVRFASPIDAVRAGISTVRQEVDLIPTLSVGENICLGRQPKRWCGLIDHRRTRRRARAALDRLGMRLDVGAILGELPMALQQMVAIARALDTDARALILDEPTSSLDADEARRLFDIVRRLRDDGLGVIFITHFIEQAFALADRMTVLRNGRTVGVWPAADLPRWRLVEAMTGRRLDALPARRGVTRRLDEPPALQAQWLGRSRAVGPTSFEVARGEVLGLAGLLGSGRSELARLACGVDRPTSGRVVVSGLPVKSGDVRASIAAGIAFIPEDRREALALDLSVRENIILATQASRGALRSLPRRRQREVADRFVKALNIRAPSLETPVRALSGGNQQKVLLARWLAMQPRILILDEPARGVDVGARAEIEALIASLRRDGVAIVLISGEIDELARMSDRVLVLRDRRAVGVIDDVSESAILARIAGSDATTENQEHAEGHDG